MAALAAHGATMVIFLSIGLIDKVQAALLQGAYTSATPAAVVYKATWPEEKNSTLYCWHAGRADESGRHYQDGAHRGGGFPRCAV